MCTCNAFTYENCAYFHTIFERVSTCISVKMSVALPCPESIVKGVQGKERAWPRIPGTCAVCDPEKAAKEAKEVKERKEATKDVSEHAAPDSGPVYMDTFASAMS